MTHLIPTITDSQDIKWQYKLDCCLITASYCALKDAKKYYKQENLEKFWPDKNSIPPSPMFIRRHVTMDNIKWYIHNRLNYLEHFKDDIWNADFLHGLARHGQIKWLKNDYPSIKWTNNGVSSSAIDIIKSCPFAGLKRGREWKDVSALYLKYSSDSISYMAGFLSVAVMFRIFHAGLGFKTYAKFSEEALPLLNQWKIPIEYHNLRRVFISPFWIALLSPWMPENIGKKWFEVKKSNESLKYAVILWNTYIDNHFKSKGLPYLKSERQVYSDYVNEELGAIKYIERLRVESGLVELDSRFKDIVRFWHNKNK